MKFHELPFSLKTDERNNEYIATADGQTVAMFFNIGHEADETEEADKETDELRAFIVEACNDRDRLQAEVDRMREAARKDVVTAAAYALMWDGPVDRKRTFRDRAEEIVSCMPYHSLEDFKKITGRDPLLRPSVNDNGGKVCGECGGDGIEVEKGEKARVYPCPACEGTGFEKVSRTCQQCDGDGKVCPICHGKKMYHREVNLGTSTEFVWTPCPACSTKEVTK